MTNKYEHFTDEEIYLLKRQAIESSFNIMFDEFYEPLRDLHGKLLNELSEEDSKRQYGRK